MTATIIYLPIRLELFIGGYTGDSFSLRWEGERLIYEAQRYGYQNGEACSIRPSRQQWQGFWRSVERAGMWTWAERYEPQDTVMDGTSWSLELDYIGRSVQSGGENAYPGTLPEHSAAAYPPEFRRYLRAVSRLAGKRPFS